MIGAPRITVLLVAAMVALATCVALASAYLVPASSPPSAAPFAQTPVIPSADDLPQPDAMPHIPRGQNADGMVAIAGGIAGGSAALVLLMRLRRDRLMRRRIRSSMPGMSRRPSWNNADAAPDNRLRPMEHVAQLGQQIALPSMDSRRSAWMLPRPNVPRITLARAIAAARALAATARHMGQDISQRFHQHTAAGTENASAPPVSAPAEPPDDIPARTPDDTAVDQTAAYLAAIIDQYRQRATQSAILLAEGGIAHHGAAARLMIDPHPDDAAMLAMLPDDIRLAWRYTRARWRHTANRDATLVVETRGSVPNHSSGAMLLPVARRFDHRRRETFVFLPLRTWRGVGFYGGRATESLNAALIALCYAESPIELAITICDDGHLSSLYQGIPHMVQSPNPAHTMLPLIGRALRRTGEWRGTIRPMLVVVVNPDDVALAAYEELLPRLQRHVDVPVFIMLAQTQLAATARWSYAAFPALITSGGKGEPAWLPGGGGWPATDHVRLVARGVRREGRVYGYDSAQIGPLTEPLRLWQGGDLPPTILDVS